MGPLFRAAVLSCFLFALSHNLFSQTEVVTVITPLNNATVTSPVHVYATFNGPASYTKLWVDHVAWGAQHNGSVFDAMVTLASGAHLLEVQAHDPNTNITYTTPVKITVSSASPPPPPGLSISSATATVVVAEQLQFTASASVTWSASCGSIDGTGMFTAPATTGTCTITGTASDGSSATASAAVVSFAVSPSSANTPTGQTQQFTANAPVSWNASCGSISASGLFTAPVSTGSCTITATETNGSGIHGTAVDNVTSGGGGGPLAVTVLTPANNSNVTSPVHVSATFNGTASYTKLWIDHVAWGAQHNGNIFDAMITLSNGAHLLEVQAHDVNTNLTYTTPVNINVTSSAGAVTITPASVNIAVGSQQQFTGNTDVSWTSTGVGNIDSNGLFTAGATAGTATVTATSNTTGATGTATVDVTPLSITPANATTVTGATQQFSANAPVNWSADCGTISSSGLFTAPSSTGTCTITASESNGSGISATATDTVTAAPPPPSGINYSTWKNDNQRTGLQNNETTLTPTNVNSSTFGLKFSVSVDGQVYAQPLYMSGVRINGATHNVVFVVTEHASVYAFDADKNGAPLWKTSFLINGATTVPRATANSTIGPEVGCTGTPAIDESTGTMYLTCETLENTNIVHRLHALDITTGHEVPGSPVVIAANGFAGKYQLQRTGVLLSNGKVYFGFGSQSDTIPYHGWVFAYSASTLARIAAWNDAPNGTAGGIWMAGQGIAADANGDIYVSTGNGSYNGTTQFSMSWVHLDQNLNYIDHFAPYNEATLSNGDVDLGSGGFVVVPDQSGSFAHELIGCGKDPSVYVVDRDNMGHIGSGSNSQIIQDLLNVVGGGGPRQPADHCFMTPAYWNNNLYFIGNNDGVKSFRLDSSTGKLASSPSSRGSFVFPFPGAQPVVSANGGSNGIVWAVDANSPAKLHAYDASNLAREIYTSPGLTWQKWSVPTVVNGRVYVATQGKLWVFGLF